MRGLSFRARLRELIGERNAVEFANAIDTNATCVYHWLSGRAAPKMETLRKIAEAEGCSLDWLVLGIGTLERRTITSSVCGGLSVACGQEYRREAGPWQGAPIQVSHGSCDRCFAAWDHDQVRKERAA